MHLLYVSAAWNKAVLDSERTDSKLKRYCLALLSEVVKGGWELTCRVSAPFFVQLRLLVLFVLFRIILLCLFHSCAFRKKKSVSLSL